MATPIAKSAGRPRAPTNASMHQAANGMSDPMASRRIRMAGDSPAASTSTALQRGPSVGSASRCNPHSIASSDASSSGSPGG